VIVAYPRGYAGFPFGVLAAVQVVLRYFAQYGQSVFDRANAAQHKPRSLPQDGLAPLCAEIVEQTYHPASSPESRRVDGVASFFRRPTPCSG
jgi:hypothetical protein